MRILDYAWHQPHSYRLMQALHDCEFYFLKVGPRTWRDGLRPKPPNFKGFVKTYELGKYDLALLHLDQWCDRYALRGYPYRAVNGLIKDIPKVLIMHGTPDGEENRQRILKMIGDDNYMVCNSQQAYEEWNLGPERSRAIIHGYNVDEFYSEKTRRTQAITVCSGGDISREYHGIPLLERMKRDVPALTWIGERGDIPFFNNYERYRNYLASALIYFHPGQRSPMPGARTEAMLSGCCIVSTDNQDTRDYIEHGVTGFLSNDYAELRDVLRLLLAEPRKAYDVGKRGREAAREVFTLSHLRQQWLSLLNDLEVSYG